MTPDALHREREIQRIAEALRAAMVPGSVERGNVDYLASKLRGVIALRDMPAMLEAARLCEPMAGQG
jgi:hypothetical protein